MTMGQRSECRNPWERMGIFTGSLQVFNSSDESASRSIHWHPMNDESGCTSWLFTQFIMESN